MKKIFILILSSLLFNINFAFATNPYINLEALVLEGKYEEAKTEFNKIPSNSHERNAKVYSYLEGSKKMSFKQYAFQDMLKYLETAKECRSALTSKNEDHINRCNYLNLPKNHPFSNSFSSYIVNLHNNLIKDFNNEIARRDEKKKKLELANKEKERKRVEEYKRQEEERRLAREDKEKKELAEKKRKKEEFEINFGKTKSKAKELGYEDFYNATIVQVVATTQKNGGLEKYLNAIIGCMNIGNRTCRRYYKDLKIIQVLEDGALYSYSKVIGREYISFTVYLNGLEKNKIYQEGQSFENALYSFQGMLSYQTVTGTTKSVPSFKKVVDIKQY